MHTHALKLGIGAVGLAAVALQAAVVVAPADAAHATSIVKDGSFTKPSQSAVTLFAKGDKIGPWRVTAGDIDLNLGSPYTVPAGLPAGAQSVDLNGSDAGALAQNLKTVPGTTYRVTFYLGGNPDGDPGFKIVNVTAGGEFESIEFDTTSSTASDPGWQSETLTFVASASRTQLMFASQTSGTSYGLLLSGVAATAS